MKKKAKKQKSRATAKKSKNTHLRPSKTDGFLENIRRHNPMVEYFMNLTVMNPTERLLSKDSPSKHDGRFVRLAHARGEFQAPILSKGKSALSAERKVARRTRRPK